MLDDEQQVTVNKYFEELEQTSEMVYGYRWSKSVQVEIPEIKTKYFIIKPQTFQLYPRNKIFLFVPCYSYSFIKAAV